MTPEYLKRIRLGFGWSQAQFAKELDLSLRQFARLESGDTTISGIHTLAIRALQDGYRLTSKKSVNKQG